jgi:transposase InsO family protein
VLDACSRKIVGWAMATHLKTELVLAAINMALAQRRPEGVMHHSDRGCRYTSFAFGKRCLEMGVVRSVGLPHPGRGQARAVRMDRRLVQPASTSRIARAEFTDEI